MGYTGISIGSGITIHNWKEPSLRFYNYAEDGSFSMFAKLLRLTLMIAKRRVQFMCINGFAVEGSYGEGAALSV